MKIRNLLALILVFALALPLAVSATEPAETLAPRIHASYTTALPKQFDPLQEHTQAAELILSLTADTLYVLGENGALVPSLAAALPEDVTAQYAGTCGIPADAARGWAFAIELDPDAAWEDGTALDADDLLFTLNQMAQEQILDLPLANLQGLYNKAQKPTDEIISLAQAGFSSMEEAAEAGHNLFYLNVGRFWGLDAGWVSILDRTRLKDSAIPSGVTEMFVSGAYLFDRYLQSGKLYDRFQKNFLGVAAEAEYVTIQDLGVLKTGTRQVVLILEEPTAALSLAVALKDLIPVPVDLYRSNYGTSMETYSACGPYRIALLEEGQMVLEPNPHWHGKREVFKADQITLAS